MLHEIFKNPGKEYYPRFLSDIADLYLVKFSVFVVKGFAFV